MQLPLYFMKCPWQAGRHIWGYLASNNFKIPQRIDIHGV